jgi:hypothetical protein
MLLTMLPVTLNTSPESPHAPSDPFEHLRLSLFARQDDVFCMLTAYFDDSGTSATDPVVVVAGYLATVEMWARFDRRWSTLLAQYEITGLHRVDLENFSGEFKDWNPRRRTEFMKKADAIIKHCTYSGFGVAIPKSDFEAVCPDHHPYRTYGLFGWCAYGCIASIKLWCSKKNVTEPIQYVFEAGTTGQNQFNQLLHDLYRDPAIRKEDRIGGWSFQGKSLLPLQAADVVAYEYFKYMRNQFVDKGTRPIRLSARDLFRMHEIEFFRHYDAKFLESLFQKRDLLPPSS